MKYFSRYVIERDGNMERAKESELDHAVLGIYKLDEHDLPEWVADFVNQKELDRFCNMGNLLEHDQTLEG